MGSERPLRSDASQERLQVKINEIQEIVDAVADKVPGVYSLVYESGMKGVEFTESALLEFVDAIANAKIKRLEEEVARLKWGAEEQD